MATTATERRKRLGFYLMADVLPQAERGQAQIEHKELRPTFRFRTKPGLYAGLKIDGRLWMSDTDDERDWNHEALTRARGNVLVAGLGLGMVVLPMLEKDTVATVTVIEQNQDVIDLVRPHLEAWVAPVAAAKLRILPGDIHTWRPATKGRQFDVVYFDIWADICTDNLRDIAALHKAFRPYLRKGGWMDSWQRQELKDLRW
jgi:hypothetical protein